MFYGTDSLNQIKVTGKGKVVKGEVLHLHCWEGSLRFGFKVVPRGSGKTLRRLSDKAAAEDELVRVDALKKLMWAYSRRYEKLLQIGAGKIAGRGSLAEISSEVRKD